MGELYQDVAKRTGAALVSNCGVDSIPSELGSVMACQRFKEQHGRDSTVQHIEALMTRFTGAFPAGSLETMAGALDGTDKLQLPPKGTTASAPEIKGATNIVGQLSGLSRSKVFRQWSVPFFMAATNSHIVQRCTALTGFASNITYTERWGFPDFWAAFCAGFPLYGMLGPWLALPLTRGLLRRGGVIPKAGAGAKAVKNIDDSLRGSCAMLVSASGRNAKGKAVRSAVRFTGVGDVGVTHTAVLHGTVCALLVKQRKEIPAGAFLTPVSALGGDVLRNALEETGMVKVDDVPAKMLRRS
jgi:short subunit dehydrogenase-like uncharacterized protein